MKKLMTAENCFSRSGDGTYLESNQWEGSNEEVNGHLNFIGPEALILFFNLLKEMMIVNRYNNSS